MNQQNGNHLKLMAKAETIKQADLAKKLRKAQDEVEKIHTQTGSINQMLKEQNGELRGAQTSAQLANSLRLGQRLEGFRTTLSLQKAQSERRLKQAKTALAQSGHKLEMLSEKARVLDTKEKSD
ncbi:hypothetical protein [Thalassobius sp. MITS945101]|uniref:hypothetical protein n=1 Tax=Thalassobius sp. MITS945101 TaxID=3096994 RepID=UPI00399AA2D3